MIENGRNGSLVPKMNDNGRNARLVENEREWKKWKIGRN